MSSTSHFLFVLVVQSLATTGVLALEDANNVKGLEKRFLFSRWRAPRDDCWEGCHKKSGVCKFCIEKFGIQNAFCCRANGSSKYAVGCNGYNGDPSYNKCTAGSDITDATTTDATTTDANDVVSGSEVAWWNSVTNAIGSATGGGNTNSKDNCYNKCNNKSGVCEYCVKNVGLSKAFCCRSGLDHADAVGCSGYNGGASYHRCVGGKKKPRMSAHSSSSSSSSYFDKVGMSGGVLLFLIGGTGIAGVGFKLFTKKRNDKQEEEYDYDYENLTPM